MRMLDFDFFEILDSVTIARSRKHIEKYYNMNEIGHFPMRLPPISKRPPLTDLSDAITYGEIYDLIISLTLSIYTPSNYILPSRMAKYADLNHEGKNSLTQAGREQGIRRLMSINLLKRLESSVHSFRLTLQRIQKLIADTLETINAFDPNQTMELQDLTAGSTDFDADDAENDLLAVGKKVHIALADMDYLTWQQDLQADLQILNLLVGMVANITPQHDSKLQMLLATIAGKISQPINPGNKKVIIFTAFSDTAEYLFTNISTYAKENYGLNTALVTGSVDGRTSVPKFKADLNNILTCFSPISKDKAALMPDGPDIDILIATDCISEGQNLQDCDCVVNYDIHWNPVRLVQRFGRIDRIGSRNDKIQLINFWPDLDLDSYINLKARVELRMKALVMTSTGDDNLLSPEEQGDLEYRRQQLQRLQTEVVDLEEMGTGVSITDLGLNEFRMELLEYSKTHPELENSPGGISAVAAATPDAPPGVVFVLKNVHNEVNADQRNRLHPYYLVYLSEEGVTVHDHLSPKDTLDAMRQLCRGKDKPIEALYQAFNRETSDGRDMAVYSGLLEDAVLSILDAKEDSDLDSLFSAGGTSALLSQVSGLDDFELICFLVVRGGTVMLNLPSSTEFGRRVPKQKFYEHLDVSPEVKRLFIDQIKLITWANKLSPQTMNLGAGQTVTEIEVFHIRLAGQELDKRTLELMDRQIPYHILFVLERPDGQMQLRISYKEAAQSGDNAFRLRQSYATEFAPPETLTLPLDALDMDSLYASIVRAIAGDALSAPEQPLEQAVAQAQEKEKLQRQIAQLKAKMKKEKNLGKQMELRREILKLEGEL